MFTPVHPSFAIFKLGLRESYLHGHGHRRITMMYITERMECVQTLNGCFVWYQMKETELFIRMVGINRFCNVGRKVTCSLMSLVLFTETCQQLTGNLLYTMDFIN